MRPILLVVVLLLVGGAVFWSLDSSNEVPSGSEDDLLTTGGGDGEGQKAPPRGPAPLMEASGAVVLDVVPPGLLEDVPDPEESDFENVSILETRIDIPEGTERLTGDLVLRSLARGLGADKPFHFVDAASLATFRNREFQVLASSQTSIGELLALCPMAGFHYFQRGGTYYLVPLPDGE